MLSPALLEQGLIFNYLQGLFVALAIVLALASVRCVADTTSQLSHKSM